MLFDKSGFRPSSTNSLISKVKVVADRGGRVGKWFSKSFINLKTVGNGVSVSVVCSMRAAQ